MQEVCEIAAQKLQMFNSDIGEHNVRFLLFVERHDFITPAQLARMRGITERGARYYLQRLVDAGYIDKIRIKAERRHSYPHQYFITRKAKKLICALYDDIEERSVRVRKNDLERGLDERMLKHYNGINDFFSRVIAQSRKLGYPGIELWANQRECVLRLPQSGKEIRPDGYGILLTDKKHVHFMLEYDRGTERYQTIIASKYERYLQYAKSELYLHQFSFPEDDVSFSEMPRVLFLTTSEVRAHNMKSFFEKTAKKERLDIAMMQNYFLFSWDGEESMKNVLGNIWLRAGYGDVEISFVDICTD